MKRLPDNMKVQHIKDSLEKCRKIAAVHFKNIDFMKAQAEIDTSILYLEDLRSVLDEKAKNQTNARVS